LGLAGGIAAFEADGYVQQMRQQVMQTRESTTIELRELGFKVLDSSANFIFIHHPHHKADWLFSELKSRGVLVRYFNKPRINDWLRVSIGTDDEMKTFLKTLQELLQ
jgi:histidinol-phosphate aminotransferase